jgi:hypothetical protein
MDAGLLELRTNAMLRALKQATEAVPGVAQLDPALGGRFEPRFTQLASQVEQGMANGAQGEDAARLLKLGEDLVAETLAFLGGAAARKFALDRGVTSLADAWLDELSQTAGLERVGVVIPDSTEFTGMLTHVVRLRLPSDGIWSLPVAVHEYGHFVASVFTRREERDGITTSVVPVEALVHGTASRHERPKLYWHGHELFADALATAVAGPAYTRYCIHYRFDPAGAQKASPTHPEPARRIRLQLAVLGKLAAAEPGSVYLEAETAAIRSAWAGALAAAGVAEDPQPDALLDPLEPQLIALLDDPKLDALRYRGQLAAQALANQLPDGAGSAETVPIALNAAWVARLKLAAPQLADLDRIAVACERLVKGALNA